MLRNAKIVVHWVPSSQDENTIRQLIQAGLDVAASRIFPMERMPDMLLSSPSFG